MSKLSAEDAIAAGLAIDDGPVLLIETADCAGGGASADSVASLKALLQLENPPSAIVPVVDPAAAAACHKAGIGARLTFALGHQLDPKWGQPVEVEGVVQTLSDGQFRYEGGIWDNVEGDMGASAVFAIGAIQEGDISSPHTPHTIGLTNRFAVLASTRPGPSLSSSRTR